MKQYLPQYSVFCSIYMFITLMINGPGCLSYSFVNQKYQPYSKFFLMLTYRAKLLPTMALDKLQTKWTDRQRTTKGCFY